jgi:hypothetical protein
VRVCLRPLLLVWMFWLCFRNSGSQSRSQSSLCAPNCSCPMTWPITMTISESFGYNKQTTNKQANFDSSWTWVLNLPSSSHQCRRLVYFSWYPNSCDWTDHQISHKKTTGPAWYGMQQQHASCIIPTAVGVTTADLELWTPWWISKGLVQG